MATPKRMKLCRPLPPELLSEMHKCLSIMEQVELIGNLPSRVIVLNNAKRVRRTLQHIREVLNANSMPETEPSNQPKEWHRSITPDLRNHLVGKLVKAIYPNWKSTHLMGDSIRIKKLIFRANVRKMLNVERECFEVAPEKETYYHMVAEKIYKIQKEKMINF